MILDDSKFDGSTFYFNFRASLLLSCCWFAVVTSPVKTCSHLSNHVNLAFFMVRAWGGPVLLENSGMKYALKFVIPKNDSTSTVVLGLEVLSEGVVLSWVDATPCAEKITPKNLMFGMLKMHFWRFRVIQQSWRCCTQISASLCSVSIFWYMSIFSYMFLSPGMSASVWWISSWNTSAAALIPNVNLYGCCSPLCV